MKRLLIAGAGGHGVVTAEAAELQGSWDVIEFVDDNAQNGDPALDWNVIGTIDEAPSLIGGGADAIVAIGKNEKRLEVANFLKAKGFALVNVVHPRATVSPRAHSQGGCLFMAGSVVNARATIGHSCIINTSASVDHDCTLGNSVHISPGAHLAANVTVGDCSWIGTGASVRDRIHIGKSCVIGAGAAVVNSIDDDTVAYGVPAKPPKKPKKPKKPEPE